MKAYSYKGRILKEQPDGSYGVEDPVYPKIFMFPTLESAMEFVDAIEIEEYTEEPILLPETYTFYISFIDGYDGYDDFEYVTAETMSDARKYIYEKYPRARIIDCYRVEE